MGNLLNKIEDLKDYLNSFRPFPQDLLLQLKEYYRIGLTYSSNAIEGNTLTESETKIIIENGITIGGKPIRDHYEAIGHAEAYNYMYSLLYKKINEPDILYLHKLFFHAIDLKNAGKYRKCNVSITGSEFIPPGYKEVPMLMSQHIQNINKTLKKLHPLEWISDLHGEFESIHPFIDGNGRIGRLIMNLLSLKHGYCPVIIPPIKRREYISALESYHKNNRTALRELIISVVYEEMKSLKKIAEKIYRNKS